MKRILSVFFVVALGFTMISGCADTKQIKMLQDQTQQALDRAQAAEQQCVASAQQAGLKLQPLKPKQWLTKLKLFS